MGLGSILGTGIFVSIGLAAGITGASVILAIALAAVVATFNALSSAQLAAAHPVSGGTYEYGYQFLHPAAGFLAGWMFLLAKSASAATAALGFAGYGTAILSIEAIPPVALAFVTVLLFTAIVLAGVRRSSHANMVIVAVTLFALAAFILVGFSQIVENPAATGFSPFFVGEDSTDSARNLLHATALMFVAYTGYGRVATLAEEVHDPRRTIPRAIIATLGLSALIYLLVAVSGIGAVGAAFLSDTTRQNAAPLEQAARAMGRNGVALIVAVGAATAMLGVLLNLILGLSRVLLAMGRRGDMPSSLTRIGSARSTPWVAVILTGVLIAGLTLIGSVETTWSFSAFTVLIYYAITNAAALALPPQMRLYPRWIPLAGMISCLALAGWVDAKVLLWGLVLSVLGLGWSWIARSIRNRKSHFEG